MKRLLGALVIGAAALSAFAQDFDRTIASIILLQTKAVQNELKLSNAQREKMNKHATTFNAWQTSYGKSLEKDKKQPDMKLFNSKTMELKNKVLNELSKTQILRLREISLQAVGVAALGDDMVAKRVGLNPDQKTKIRNAVNAGLQQAQKIQEDAAKKARAGIKEPKTQEEAKKAQELYGKRLQAAAPDLNRKLGQVRDSTEAKVLGMMSTPQKTAWTTLQGRKFNPAG